MEYSRLETYIDDLCTLKGVPGCEAVIHRGYEEIFRYRAGCSDYEKKVPMKGDEIFILYSCTKPITAVAGMRLVEEGKLGLDDPVSMYLPPFADVYLRKEGQKVKPQKPMLIRHLFTMTAGMDYNLHSSPMRELVRSTQGKAGNREIACAKAQEPLHFEPGERYLYSFCHDVLAAVIEVVVNQSFGDYLQQLVFLPLGMADTYFCVPEEKKHRIAAQFMYQEREGLVPLERNNRLQITPNHESGGAGLFSTVNDYAAFAVTMANGGVSPNGYRLLKKETVDLLRTEQLSSFAKDTTFSCSAGPGYGYGLGVRTLIDRSGGQRSSLGEFGWCGVAGSYILMDPAQKISIVFAMHVNNWPKMVGSYYTPIRDMVYDILEINL